MAQRTRRRQRAEVMLEMLRIAREPILLLNLRRECKIWWRMAHPFSDFLVKKGFMEILPMADRYKKDRGRQGARSTGVYHTTQKGVELLEQVEATALYELFTYRLEAEG